MLSNLTLVLFLIGCAGFVCSLIYLLINTIRKSEKKKLGFKLVGGFAGLAIVAILVQGFTNSPKDSNTVSNSTQTNTQVTNTQNNNLLTSADKDLLKKSYKDFSSNERTKFAEIEEKYSKMLDSDKQSIKSDFERLSKERDIQVAQWKAEDDAKAKAEAEAKAKENAENLKKATAGKMTKDKFEQIQNGMTYEQVTQIIGGPGEILSESGEKGTEYYTVMYQYEGIGSLGANSNLMFQGGKLINKAQYGLR